MSAIRNVFHLASFLMVMVTYISPLAVAQADSSTAATTTAAGGLFGDLSRFSLPSLSAFTLPPLSTPCVGQSTLGQGFCQQNGDCESAGGVEDGKCLVNQGSCCIRPAKCGSQSLLNNSYFSNADYPKPSTTAGFCNLTVDRNSLHIQVRLELIKFEVGTPDADGKCLTDYMFVDKVNPGFVAPRLCGKNSGQHMILPIDQLPLLQQSFTIGFQLSGNASAVWVVKVIYIQNDVSSLSKSSAIAPAGCLQWYVGKSGNFSSFNRGANLDGLRYATCFRPEVGYCSINFVSSAAEESGNRTRRNAGYVNAGNSNYNYGRVGQTNGVYANAGYVHPVAANQKPAAYVYPVQGLVNPNQFRPQRPVYRPSYYKYPSRPAYYKPVAQQGYYPVAYTYPTSTNATAETTMPTVTDGPTEGNVTEATTPSAACTSDTVTFPPSTVLCGEIAPGTTVVENVQPYAAFINNNGNPHSSGFTFSYNFVAC